MYLAIVMETICFNSEVHIGNKTKFQQSSVDSKLNHLCRYMNNTNAKESFVHILSLFYSKYAASIYIKNDQVLENHALAHLAVLLLYYFKIQTQYMMRIAQKGVQTQF